MQKHGWAAFIVALGMLSSVSRGVVASLPDLIEVDAGTVYRWNPGSAGNIYLRGTGTAWFGDLTRLNDGRYVAYRTVYGGKTPALYEINPITGAATKLVENGDGAGKVIALAPMQNGNLLGDDNDLGFVSINPDTLAYTRLTITASNSARTMNTGAMAVSPDGVIYAWLTGLGSGTGNNHYAKLFTIDPVAATAQEIGGSEDLTSSQSFQAMSFTPDGRLFGFSDINYPYQPSSIFEFDLHTGFPTQVAQRSELSGVRGVMFIPEPSAQLLMMVAMASLLWRVRRPGQA